MKATRTGATSGWRGSAIRRAVFSVSCRTPKLTYVGPRIPNGPLNPVAPMRPGKGSLFSKMHLRRQVVPKVKIRRALFTVSDKAGIVELAQALAATGTELVA